jgi:hypothetical protein
VTRGWFTRTWAAYWLTRAALAVAPGRDGKRAVAWLARAVADDAGRLGRVPPPSLRLVRGAGFRPPDLP